MSIAHMFKYLFPSPLNYLGRIRRRDFVDAEPVSTHFLSLTPAVDQQFRALADLPDGSGLIPRAYTAA